MTSKHQPYPWQRAVRLLTGVTLLSTVLHAQATNNGTQPTGARPAASPNNPGPNTAPGAAEDESIITLSPFTVDATKDKGYYAENTLAGSRLKTNIGDIAASITVVTKQQMEDTASLDINDVFRYEANTEGSATYTPQVIDRGTAKDTIAGYSFGNTGGVTTNAQSNRVRGLAAPDASLNYFSVSARVPFDAYNTQSVEISRGPNSLLFGLGSPAGIVNQTATQAALNKNTYSVQFRTDNYGSYRGNFGANRSIIDDKLAIYVAGLYDNRQFQRKPSYDLTRREYGALTFKPFKKTVIRGFAENFNNYANRPNSLTPRDLVTPWLQAGRPIYDPTTRMVTVQDTGKTYGPYVSSTLSPGWVPGALTGNNALNATTSIQFVPGIQFGSYASGNTSGIRPWMRIGPNGQLIDYFEPQPTLYVPAWTNPATAVPTAASLGYTAGDPRFLLLDRMVTGSSLTNPTMSLGSQTGLTIGSYGAPGVTNKSIYDWTKYNTLHSNFGKTHASTYDIELEQELLPNLFLSAAWLRQDIDSVENYTVNQLGGATLTVDTNSKNIDGTPNPYVGLPFISDYTPDIFYHPETADNYRAMLAYELDFTRHSNWLRWLGHHRIMTLWSDQVVKSRNERWRMNFASGDSDAMLRFMQNRLLPITQNSQTLWNNSSGYIQRNYYMANPGDPQARVSTSTGFWGNKGWDGPYSTSVQVYNFNTGQFQNDQITQQAIFSDASSNSNYREVESYSLATQNYLLDDRIITTLGWRRDQVWLRQSTAGAIIDDAGKVVVPALTAAQIYDQATGLVANKEYIMRRWGRWDRYWGNTSTIGAAVRPLKGLNFVERPANEGAIWADLLRGLTLYYNRSSNFNPPSIAQNDFFGVALPKPTGKGKDIGFGFSMLNNKLVGRISWFKTDNIAERVTNSTFVGRTPYGDTTLMFNWAKAVVRIQDGADYLNDKDWNNDQIKGPLTDAQIDRVYALMKLPRDYYSNIGTSGATQQSQAKGVELQLTYNPTPNWTMKLTGAKQETVYTKVAPEFDAFVATRMPVWTTAVAPINIPDFTDKNGTEISLQNFWSAYGYTGVVRKNDSIGNTNSRNYWVNTVQSAADLSKALEGQAAPEQRKYHGSFLSTYAFTRGKLRGWAVGGAERYESKAVIGYIGRIGDPTQPTLVNVADITKPIYDSDQYYTDLWVSYTRKIFSDKVKMKIQLNVINAWEDGRLQPIAVNYNGQPYGFRIIDSRQFNLTTSFDF